jgi:hypothetical protein
LLKAARASMRLASFKSSKDVVLLSVFSTKNVVPANVRPMGPLRSRRTPPGMVGAKIDLQIRNAAS